MTRDEIAAELMRLHTHLRASADPATKRAIRRRIDGLIREAAQRSGFAAPEAATDGPVPPTPIESELSKVRS
jgi:hypothetical protein